MSEKKADSVQDLLSFDLDSIVEEGQKKTRKKKKQTALVAIIAGVVCVAIVAALVYTKVIVPSKQYNDAAALLEQGEYQAAIDAFTALGNYKDSADMILETQYKWAEKMLADKSYDEAYSKFEEIKDYSDAATRMNDVRYAQAEAYIIEENLEAALQLFSALGDFKDSKTRADEVYEMMQIHATAVNLSKTSLSVSKGKTAELTATMEPADTTDSIVGWTSSDTSVATVDENGVVTAVDYGTATIEVKTSNELTASCKVTVPEPEKSTPGTGLNNSGTTNGSGQLSYGTSTNLPATAVPLTSNALAGVWKSNIYAGQDFDYIYFLRFSGNSFVREHDNYRDYNSLREQDITEYIDTGTFYIDGPNIVVTYTRYDNWRGTTSGWKTETWPVEYIHPGGIRFTNGLLGVTSYYKMDDRYYTF